MSRITISYRREDSGVITGRIFDRLVGHYGRESVFRDIDSIPPGVDFRKHINHVLDQSDIVLALVGPRWLGARGGQSRLADEADLVRVEIETALAKNVPLIPVLVLRGTMPRAQQLPESMRDFAFRNAVQVDAGQDFDVHISRLIRAMDRILSNATLHDIEDVPDDVIGWPGGNPIPSPPPIGNETGATVQRQSIAPPVPMRGDGLEGPPPEAAPVADDPLPTEIAAADPGAATTPALSRRGLGAVIVLAVGLLAGGVAVLGVNMYFGPPPRTGQDKSQHAAALDATQQQAAAAADRQNEAQKQLDLQNRRLQQLQAQADQATRDLATQKEIDAKASAVARRDTAPVQLDEQNSRLQQLQARADQAASELAAQKGINAKALAQIDQFNEEIKSLRSQLALIQPPAPPAAAPAPASLPKPDDEADWTAEQKRSAESALRALGYYLGEANGSFGDTTRQAIRNFQSDAGDPETGSLTPAEARQLFEMAQRLSALIERAPISPEGVAGSSIKGGAQRYARAWNFEPGNGGRANPAEAVYWYGLAAGDGEARAFTNLGTLLARGWGTTKPDTSAAALLWTAAAARGEAIAMYDLGIMYERGIGVAPDSLRARSWYARAAAHNHSDARAALKRLTP